MLARVARPTTRVLRFLPVLLIGFWLADAIVWPHFANAEDGGGGGGAGGGGAGGGAGGGGGSGGGTGGGSGSAGESESEGSSSSAAGAGASGQTGSASSTASGVGAIGNSSARNPTLDALVVEQGLASAAVSQGKIRPFSEILRAVIDAVPGSILSVHLRQRPAGAWIYNLVVLSPEGRYRKITVDATNSHVLQIK